MTAASTRPVGPLAGLGLHPRVAGGTLAALVLLFVPGVLSFGPVFDGLDGYVAAGGGVLLGLALGVLARRFRWAAATTAAAAVGAYLLFGGVLALRRTTFLGYLPTADTLLRLVPLSVQSWRDLLTVSPPANNFVGPAVVPYLAGLVLALAAAALGLRPRRHLWALAPALTLLVLGILWGLDVAPLAAFLGAGFGVIALAWAAWRRAEEHREGGEQILLAGSASLGTHRWGGAAAMLAGASALALAASPLLGSVGADRQVLRQVVQPPLNLADYASPLAAYRYLELDAKDMTMFTVAGLPQGARLRLAAMDAYDGHVYSVADASAAFLRIGERTSGTGRGTPTTLSIAVAGYTGLWLPGGGDVRGVRFGGPQAERQAEGLYYNSYGGTLLTTATVGDGDRYTVDLVVPPAVDRASVTKVAAASEPALERVPDAITTAATDLAGDAGSPLEQLQRIEKKLQEGYYSDGSDGKSRAGHTAERIASMLTAPTLVGDDEQYAVAMALMARQLGIPARVVMGFYPDPKAPASGTLEVKGTMAHVWVEVPFEGAGWLAFDPTPDRIRTPQTTVPKPLPKPKPQVLPPPDPPVNKATDPTDEPGKKREEEQKQGNDLLLRIALSVAAGLGGAAVVAGPFVAIGALKRRRRARRENAASPALRASGSWAELVDAATDLGVPVSSVATRRETATALHGLFPAADVPRVAAAVDAGVFGASAPTADLAAGLWSEVDASLAAMRSGLGRWRRIRAFCSLRSFGRPRLPLDGIRSSVNNLAGVLLRRPGKASA